MRYVVRAAMASVCMTLCAQTPPARPQFEVATVKPAANHHANSGMFAMMREMMRNEQEPGAIPMPNPDRVHLEDWSLRDLIASAYGVRANQVSGPDWLSDQGFDIEATVAEGTKKEELNAMLQSLLEERFGLKVHRGSQTGQGYALVVGKDGPKLKPAAPRPAAVADGLTPAERQAQVQQRMQARLADAKTRQQDMSASGAAPGNSDSASFDSITTEELAAQLVRFAGAPVVDETGLTGDYSASIKTWTNADVPGGTIFDAVGKLGLKLEPRKVTVDTVVVDQVSKTPTAN